MKSIMGLSASLLLVAQPAGDTASQARIAGYLKGLVRGTGRVDIVRTGTPVEANRGMPPLDGDRIIITGNAKIYIMSNVLELNGNKTSENSPIVFPMRAPPPGGAWGTVTRLLAALGVSMKVIERPPASAAQTPTKGVGDCPPRTSFSGPLEPVPVLASRTQYLDGPGASTLAWTGGTSPYRVEYKTSGGWVRLSQSALCLTHASLEVPLSDGAAQLRVRDADDKEIVWNLQSKPSGRARGGLDYDRLVEGMTDMADPGGHYGVAGLSKLNGLSEHNFVAWRLLSAVYENNLTE